jgi:hypothetical protein
VDAEFDFACRGGCDRETWPKVDTCLFHTYCASTLMLLHTMTILDGPEEQVPALNFTQSEAAQRSLPGSTHQQILTVRVYAVDFLFAPDGAA